MTEEIDVLAAIQEDAYRWGDLQAVRYDKTKFPDDYLGHLYNRCRESRRRSGNGILDALFGGNPASDFPSIVTYLAQRPVLLILGKWEEEKFVELGFAFPTVSMGGQNTEHSLIAGYGFFREAWGTEDQQILTMLGLAFLFKEFSLSAIIGNRYADNTLTAKFMSRFGFKDCGEIPRFQLRGTKLVSMVVSALLREDFEEYVRGFLVGEWRAAHQPAFGVEYVQMDADIHFDPKPDSRTIIVETEPPARPEPVEQVAIVEVEPAVEQEQPFLPLSWM